jgi:TonB family protein
MNLRFVIFFFFSVIIHASIMSDGLNFFSNNDTRKTTLPLKDGGQHKTTLRLITVQKTKFHSLASKKNKHQNIKSDLSDIERAKLKNGLNVKYPFLARINNLSGTVVLSIKVGVAGVVENVQVKKSSGHRILDQEAIRQVNLAKFNPGRVQGKPVASNLDVVINFKI